MTQDTAHMNLDELGLEAAVLAHDKEEAAMRGEPDPWCDDRPKQEFSDRIFAMNLAIRAYLQTAAADVSGLVGRLRDMGGGDPAVATCHEAASTLQTLSASNAALEAEIERLRGALKQTEYLMTKDSFSAAERLSEGLAHVRQARAALSAPKGGQDHG